MNWRDLEEANALLKGLEKDWPMDPPCAVCGHPIVTGDDGYGWLHRDTRSFDHTAQFDGKVE